MPAHQVRSYGPYVTEIPHYEIRIKGHLGSRWVAWFDGFTLTDEEDGITVLRGQVVDQSALHGVIQKVRDLGITLVSLVQLPSHAPTAPCAPRTNEGT